MTSPTTEPSSEAKQLIKTLRALLSAGHLSPKFQIKGESLHVLVTYSEGFKPDERTLADHIRKSLKPLPRGEFQFLSLYGCTQGQNHPDWMQKITLLESPIVSLPTSVPASPPVIPTSSRINKAQPSKSITTVKPRIPLLSFKDRSARTKAVAHPYTPDWKPLRQAFLAVAAMTAMASVGVHVYFMWLRPQSQSTFEAPDEPGGFETIRSVAPVAEANLSQSVPSPSPPAVTGQAEINWGPWMSVMNRQIQENRRPRQPGDSRSGVVLFSVDRDGSISSIQISHSSGHEATDNAVIQEISEAAPFRSLPSEYVGDTVQISFTFN